MSDDDIDLQDFFGVTPLMYAVQLGQADFVKILVDKKADQSITDNVGHTAYDIAPPEIRDLGYLEMRHSTEHILRKYILQPNAEGLESLLTRDRSAIDKPDHCGETPLMLAAIHNRVQCLKILLNFGADQTIRNKAGESAFDVASSDEIRALLNPINGSAEILRQYIASGDRDKLRCFLGTPVGKSLKDKQDILGFTPLMFAVVLDRVDCINVLLEAGVDQSILNKVTILTVSR